MKFLSADKKVKFFIFLVSILILSQFRLIDHPWNFTPIIACGILLGYYLKNILYGYSFIILSMICFFRTEKYFKRKEYLK